MEQREIALASDRHGVAFQAAELGQVAKSLYNRGVAHGLEGDDDAAIADYTLVVERYSSDIDPEMRAVISR